MIEWIPHNGDECPVKPGTLVEADYGAVQMTMLAESVDWSSVRRYRVRMPEGYADARTVPADDGWIDWAGGECPVSPNTVVEICCRFDARARGRGPAERWSWGHKGLDSDIVRYRIVSSPFDLPVNDRADDRQEAGTHYREMPVQPWTVMASCMPDGFPGFLRGNVLKYAMRAGAKGPALDDARKCAHYAQKWVETLETQSGHGRTQEGHA